MSKLKEAIAKEIQEIKKAWDKKGQDGSHNPSGRFGKRGKKGGQVNEVAAVEKAPTNDAR